MARTLLATQKSTIAGIAPVFTAANVDGHYIVNDGHTVVQVKNAGGSPITVTLPTPGKVAGVDIVDPTVSIPATTGDKIIGPFDPRVFAQADGSVNIDFSGVTSVTVAAFSAA